MSMDGPQARVALLQQPHSDDEEAVGRKRTAEPRTTRYRAETRHVTSAQQGILDRKIRAADLL